MADWTEQDVKRIREWNEADHPRGQPNNAGQFVEKETSKKIKQLDWFESEYRRILQIKENTGFNDEEARAIYDAVRDYTDNGYTAIRQGKSERQAKLIEQLIERHPKHEGRIYRGIAVDDDSFIAKLRKAKEDGVPIDMGGISSWSGAESVAKEFADESLRDERGRIKIIFEMDNVNGIGVDHLSFNHGEEEVLHSKKARFSVKSIIESDGYTIVKLEEV